MISRRASFVIHEYWICLPTSIIEHSLLSCIHALSALRLIVPMLLPFWALLLYMLFIHQRDKWLSSWWERGKYTEPENSKHFFASSTIAICDIICSMTFLHVHVPLFAHIFTLHNLSRIFAYEPCLWHLYHLSISRNCIQAKNYPEIVVNCL